MDTEDRSEIETLLAKVARKDRAAFAQLYDRTSAKLYGISLRVLKDDSAAQDALQTTFNTIWRAAGRFTPGATSPMTWLITIARNTAIDALRRQKGLDIPGTEAALLPGRGLIGAGAVIGRDEALRVAHCMAQLKSAHREAVHGAYLDGLTYAELAHKRDTPPNTMRTGVRRAFLSLRECLSR